MHMHMILVVTTCIGPVHHICCFVGAYVYDFVLYIIHAVPKQFIEWVIG